MIQSKSTLISIVIPVYNGADYIQSAIDSVLQQDYSNVELIVLDDGSTDNSRDILKRYGYDFYWETHDNMGQANTLNKGWSLSKGKILGYLSADDELLPSAVSRAVNTLNNNPKSVMTYCDFNLINSHSKIIRSVRLPEFSYEDMVINYFCAPGPGVFFLRNVFEAAGGWNPNYRQMPDYDFWLRLGLMGGFIRIPEILASFRVHEASQTFSKGNSERSDEPISIISNYFKNEDNIPKYILNRKAEAVSTAHIVSAQLHLRSNRARTSMTRFMQAINIFPKIILRLKFYKVIANGLFYRIRYKIFNLSNRS